MTQFRWLLAGLIALAMPGTLAWGQSVINYTYEERPTCGLVPPSCDDATRAEKYLEMWQLLWSCELYHEAENLATVAARSCPDSVDLQHALFVSQLVNTERTPAVPDLNQPITGSRYDYSIPQFGGYPITDIEESEFGIEIGLGGVEKSESEQPKACVKGGSKRRCHAHVKPACVKSCEDMPCGGIVRCQHVECGALVGGMIGTGVSTVTGNALGALVGVIAGRQDACCESKSCCAQAKSCAGCTKSCKDGCCCKPNACECEKNCSCGKDPSCNSNGCCTPPCCGTTNGCCAMGHKDEPFTIGRIVIVGNDTTQDRVIRRVLDLHPGQVVKASDLTRAEQSLGRLGLFETSCGVHPTITAVSAAECPLRTNYGISFKALARPRTKDLVVTVQECQTGSLLLGGGLNSNNGVFGSIDLNEKNFECVADIKKAACACGKDCCCAKKCACGKDCACGGKTVSHCPWLELLRHHPRAAMHILHAPMMPPFVHGMMPPPHMPVGCMPMPSPVMPPLPPPHMPVGCMPMPGMGFPPHVMMPPCPGAAPFAAVVSPNGQFMRWQMAFPGMQPEQCVPAPVSVPAVAAQWPVHEQLPMPREVGVIPGTPRARNVLVSRPVAGQPMPPCPPLAPVLHYDIGLPPVANETPDHTVRFHALKNGIHVSNSQFDARCDHATMGDNNRVLLEGNVHIEIRRQHMPACIEAECVAVNLRDGSFEVNPSRAVPMPKALSIPGQPVNRTMYVPGLPMPTMTPCQPPCPEFKCYPSTGPPSTPPTPRTGGGR